MEQKGKMPRLLLHCCCAPCSSATLERLQQEYDTDIYYYNPNIEPETEFRKRAEEEKRFVREFRPDGGVNVIIAPYDHEAFIAIAKGREDLPERGERCYLCYELRMRRTAEYAKANGYDCFTTSLSISPYKSARWINEIGERLAEELHVSFLYSDFKKRTATCDLSNCRRNTTCIARTGAAVFIQNVSGKGKLSDQTWFFP